MKHETGLRAGLLACALAIAIAPGAAWADDRGATNEAGVGALAALSTIIYGPVKICYAALGLVFGGVAWGLSGGDGEVMSAVVTPAVRGDYVVTPSVIRMEDSLEFFGRHPRYRVSNHASVQQEDLVAEDY